MRLFGHPVHVMLVHFPVALWPAHLALHLGASRLPAGVAAIAGFWLLAAATILGWLAAACGAMDLAALARTNDAARFRSAGVHALVNGLALLGFTAIASFEYRDYPAIAHGPAALTVEAGLVLALFAGNYFGAKVVWGDG